MMNREREETCLCGIKTIVLEETDSTNNEAKRIFTQGETSPCLILAKSQTGGRGRMGRTFLSPAGKGLYWTLLFPLGKAGMPCGGLSLTAAASVAVMRAIRNLTGKQTEIKWVNDLFYRGKKVCGILAELTGTAGNLAMVFGIGLNLRKTSFPHELAEIAGSLDEETLPMENMAEEILKRFLPYLNNPADTSWVEDYRRYSCVIGKEIDCIQGKERRRALAVDINEQGFLLVRYADGTNGILNTGEISVRIAEK